MRCKQGTWQPGRSLLVVALWLSLAVALAGQPPAVSAESPGKVTVCHKPGTPAEVTLEISASAEAAHIAHGDYVGVCHPPVSPGCAELNMVVPDPQTDPFQYYFAVQGLTFFPGDVIHATITVTTVSFGGADAYVYGGSNILALDTEVTPDSGGTVTASVNYTVVAGDNADQVAVDTAAILILEVNWYRPAVGAQAPGS